MRPRLVLAVAVVLLLAGCTTSFGTVTQEATSDSTSTAERMSSPDTPDELTNESAKAVALDNEAAFVHNRLRNATEIRTFSVRENTTTYVDAEVINESEGGIYVSVHMPYSYSTADVEADGSTDAVYFVTTATVRRVRGGNVTV